MKSGFRRAIFSLLVKRFLPVRTNGVDRRLRTTSAAILKQRLESMPNESIPVFTIGFTKKSAAQFFEKLRANDVRRVVDVRLNNVSQLAVFSETSPRRGIRRGAPAGADAAASRCLQEKQRAMGRL